MRPQQLQGLDWMVSLHHNGLSGILADEMGLGKTVQTITFLGAYLKHYRDISGPHLIVAPKNTLQKWKQEFERWILDSNVIVLTGTKEERAELIANRLYPKILRFASRIIGTSLECEGNFPLGIPQKGK
ncbi:hypothetical protein PISMIDRAFT_111457 [Pisolithus microcarpus 441]|uniref:Helicase ATP-binding domain-containing protein n=1 Tax=Pisolithus microcarpus 441 TaxID=765257 RepID=A0A0C9ZBV9_9AGAM|nr:SNF2 family N-terminal domain-containing protein [Pisolithus microcarpus]KIK17428.1 hypothetical protein PISMIDRAFT_111457 [Pisolithus microcarpus 441]